MIGLYECVKWIHVISSTVLFGLGLGTAYYMWQGWRSDRAGIAAAVGRMVVRADWIFTLTSGIVQPVSGALLVMLGGWNPDSFWLTLTYGLYALAFLCWVPVVRLQIQATHIAAAERDDAALPDLYHRKMRIWFALGWPAFIALLIIFMLMIARPEDHPF